MGYTAVRGGLQAIPKGQYEAADALGLSTFDSLRFIILPQALTKVIPAIVGQFIGLFKDTSLASLVGLDHASNGTTAKSPAQPPSRGSSRGCKQPVLGCTARCAIMLSREVRRRQEPHCATIVSQEVRRRHERGAACNSVLQRHDAVALCNNLVAGSWTAEMARCSTKCSESAAECNAA